MGFIFLGFESVCGKRDLRIVSCIAWSFLLRKFLPILTTRLVLNVSLSSVPELVSLGIRFCFWLGVFFPVDLEEEPCKQACESPEIAEALLSSTSDVACKVPAW